MVVRACRPLPRRGRSGPRRPLQTAASVTNRVPETVENEIVEIRKQLTEFGVEAGPDTIHTHLTPPTAGSLRAQSRASGGSSHGAGSSPPSRTNGPRAPTSASKPRSRMSAGRWTSPTSCCRTGAVSKCSTSSTTTAASASPAAPFRSRPPPTSSPPSTKSPRTRLPRLGPQRQRRHLHRLLPRRPGALATELARLGIVFKHSRPYHPQTCGKVERFHQTLKKYLAANPAPRSLTQLQAQLDVFATYYNDVRPHRAKHRMTPRAAYNARVKARPRQHRSTTPASSVSAATGSTRPAK